MGVTVQAKDAVPELPVRMLDVKAGVWSTLSVGGEAPGPRGGHTVGDAAVCCNPARELLYEHTRR